LACVLAYLCAGSKPRSVRGAPWNLSLKEIRMHALKDLFATDYGIMSVMGITFTLCMMAFFVRYFLRHMREDEAREKARQAL
jgi:hypothetical protein